MTRRPIGQIDLGVIDRLRLGWRLLRDPRMPWPKWVIPALATIYVLSPIDGLPDFIPILGQIDDLSVVALALAVVATLIRWAPDEVVAEHTATLNGHTGFAAPRQRQARQQGSQQTIEANYWVDDWR